MSHTASLQTVAIHFSYPELIMDIQKAGVCRHPFIYLPITYLITAVHSLLTLGGPRGAESLQVSQTLRSETMRVSRPVQFFFSAVLYVYVQGKPGSGVTKAAKST